MDRRPAGEMEIPHIELLTYRCFAAFYPVWKRAYMTHYDGAEQWFEGFPTRPF
jgi:hypothetical protein